MIAKENEGIFGGDVVSYASIYIQMSFNVCKLYLSKLNKGCFHVEE